MNSSCSEFSNSGYHCVPYYQCDTCNTIIVDGVSLFDPRSSCGTSKETFLVNCCNDAPLGENHRLATTSKCSKQIEVCCRHPSSTPPEDEEEIFEKPDCSINNHIFGISDEACFPEEPRSGPGKQCGIRNINGVTANTQIEVVVEQKYVSSSMFHYLESPG